MGYSVDYHFPIEEEDKEALFPERIVHHLMKESYVWNFSLIYRNRNFDLIKWKTSFTWKESDSKELTMEKGLFIGASGGVFIIGIDENIAVNFLRLADIMNTFIQKTFVSEAPFIVYAVVEDKKKIEDLKKNKEMLKNIADIKNWVSQRKGEFRLENLKEIKNNLIYFMQDFIHYLLSKLKSKTNYPDLELGEVHYLDYHDISTLKEIEGSLTQQLKSGESVDDLLSELFLKYLKMPEIQKEVVQEQLEISKAPVPSSTKVKLILEEIRKGIRRQCPKCHNNERNKIREVIDKDNLIMENPNIYGFKYICGICGFEWRTKKDWKLEKEN